MAGEKSDQKLKLLYVMKILLEKTDEEHQITMADILRELEDYGIAGERKSIYADIETLRTYGMDIDGHKEGKNFYYRVLSRDFEIAELKLLVDSIQSAKFITEKKSNDLIKKLTTLASVYQGATLKRQVYNYGRVKSINESIYYYVDMIHQAIADNKKIRFQYFAWNPKKEQVIRHDGVFYEVSPWALSWDDENYYLVAYDAKDDKVKHFRVDKMLNVSSTDILRDGTDRFKNFNMATYAKKMFGMFDGEERMVQILCKNYLAGVIIDRFGTDATMIQVDDEHFQANVKVAVSKQFLGWIMALTDAKIVGPQPVVDMVKEEIDRLANQYK